MNSNCPGHIARDQRVIGMEWKVFLWVGTLVLGVKWAYAIPRDCPGAEEHHAVSNSLSNELWYPQRNRCALGKIAEEYGPKIYSSAKFRWGWNHEDLEDLVQDVFLALMQYQHGFSGAAGLGTWLRTTTFRIAVDRMRSKQAIKHAGNLKRHALDADCEDTRSNNLISETEISEVVEKLHRRLTPICAVVIAQMQAGITKKKIAEKLDLATVPSSVWFARH